MSIWCHIGGYLKNQNERNTGGYFMTSKDMVYLGLSLLVMAIFMVVNAQSIAVLAFFENSIRIRYIFMYYGGILSGLIGISLLIAGLINVNRENKE